jgi:hypothetical protein
MLVVLSMSFQDALGSPQTPSVMHPKGRPTTRVLATKSQPKTYWSREALRLPRKEAHVPSRAVVVGVSPTSPSVETASVETFGVGQLLAKLKLKQYLSAFDEAGYDDAEFLRGLSADGARKVTTAVGMMPGHAHVFVHYIKTGQLFVAEQHSPPPPPPPPPPSPAPSENKVHKLLIHLNLQRYASAFDEAGYDDADFLLHHLDEDGVHKLAKTVGMKPGHAHKLAKHVVQGLHAAAWS